MMEIFFKPYFPSELLAVVRLNLIQTKIGIKKKPNTLSPQKKKTYAL